MDKTAVLENVNKIFINVLDNDEIKLAMETTAQDVEEWDSLNHIQIIVAIEKHFKVKFTSDEIRGWKNVGEMCESIHRRES